MLGRLKSRLKGRVVILGIGNTLRSDDGAGSILASRIKDKMPFTPLESPVPLQRSFVTGPAIYSGVSSKKLAVWRSKMVNPLSQRDKFERGLKPRSNFLTELTVFDAGTSPENYLEKIIKEKPDTVVLIDAVDFEGLPGEYKVLEADEIKTANLFSTHNPSISLMINYLQNNLKVDIIVLIIQPKSIAFADKLSPQVANTLNKLEEWFSRLANNVKC